MLSSLLILFCCCFSNSTSLIGVLWISESFLLTLRWATLAKKLLSISGFNYFFVLELKVFPKHDFRFKTIYPSQRHFTPPLKSITRIFPIFGKYDLYFQVLENTSQIFKFWKIRVIFSKFSKHDIYFEILSFSENTSYIF